jgi:hypothetical protein
MSNSQLHTPVVLIIFKRPDTTEKVFEAIRLAQPQRLFVIADGPRPDKAAEAEKCAETRAILDRVDWPCEVFKDYSEENLGCQKRVSSGLNWVFHQVEEAIILEDDCVPHPTFFQYCETLLDDYRHDTRIMSISGITNQFQQRSEHSYYYSLYNSCWGWATWKRAWKYFDFDMKLWPIARGQGWLHDLLIDEPTVKFWTDTYQSVYEGKFNTWAYRWKFACWMQSGLSIIPNVNLISNIGFGDQATNTRVKQSNRANQPVEAIAFPLKHPPLVIRDRQAERYVQRVAYHQSRLSRIKRKLKKLLFS